MEYPEKYAVIFEQLGEQLGEQRKEGGIIDVINAESEEVRKFLSIIEEVDEEEEVVTYSTSSEITEPSSAGLHIFQMNPA